jgi:hypothetical protein
MKKKIIIFISLCILIGLIIFLFISENSEVVKSNYKVSKIFASSLNQTVFIIKETWGISSDHQRVVISTSNSESKPDSSKEYIFSDSEFFYKLVQDTIYVYTMSKARIPSKFESKIKIKQIEISNPDLMDLYKNYKSKGLELP